MKLMPYLLKINKNIINLIVLLLALMLIFCKDTQLAHSQRIKKYIFLIYPYRIQKNTLNIGKLL